MPITSIGDMAQHMMMSRRNTEVRNNLDRLAYELSSGRKSDVAQSLKGDFNLLAGVERELTVLQGYEVATTDAEFFTDVGQAVLQQVQDTAGGLGRDLFSAVNSGLSASVNSVSQNAANDFDAIVNALNTRAGDRTVFAGTATDGAALISSQDMMTQLSAAVLGLTTVADVVAAVDDYFMSPGGGFETNAYLGSNTDLAPFRLSDNEVANFDVRADDPEIREAMRDSALAAMAIDPGLGFDLEQKKDLIAVAGERLLLDQDALIETRADVGFNQERIDSAVTNNAAQRSALLMTQSDLLGVDETEVAGQLQAVQVQLEMVYTITARLSQLTLANYVR
ncbi:MULTISPECIES: flagellin [unclassified Shimia]|uniref:flagellin n=1 Tax=unclassified Shimia TaxID=2630038 RepID=UPI0031045310